MRFVALARKPLEEPNVAQNVLRSGTGALHINPSRIPTQENRARFNKARTEGSSYVVQKETLYIDPGGDGRFPSNLVLAHKSSCRIEGIRQVKTGTAVRRHIGHSIKGGIVFAKGQWDEEMRDDVTYASEGNIEVVPNWICECGCPVPDLDSQSGECRDSTIRPYTEKKQRDDGFFRNPRAKPAYDYGGYGGASRFFKQVQDG